MSDEMRYYIVAALTEILGGNQELINRVAKRAADMVIEEGNESLPLAQIILNAISEEIILYGDGTSPQPIGILKAVEL